MDLVRYAVSMVSQAGIAINFSGFYLIDGGYYKSQSIRRLRQNFLQVSIIISNVSEVIS